MTRGLRTIVYDVDYYTNICSQQVEGVSILFGGTAKCTCNTGQCHCTAVRDARQGRSTTHALIAIQHKWMQTLDNKGSVRALFVDFKKAFDIVNHNILFF